MAAPAKLLNIVHEIKLDHDNVRDLYERFKAAMNKDEKAMVVNTLIREIAIHSDAEEVSVYNHFESWGLGDVAEHNREEHAEIRRLTYEVDEANANQSDYDQIVHRAVIKFLEHAAEEEGDQLTKIEQNLTAEQSDNAAREFLKHRRTVPTQPYAWEPQTGGVMQQETDIQAKLHEKIMEALGHRQYVDVKYTHPQVEV